MTCHGCDAATAFALLRRVSSVRNVKIRELAALLVVTVTTTPAGLVTTDDAREQVRQILAVDAQEVQAGSTDAEERP